MAGTLFLIPTPIAADTASGSTSPEVRSLSARLQCYVVENARTARRVLRAWHQDLVLESIEMLEWNKHGPTDFSRLRQWLAAGLEVGLMSEAGCPAVADPGADAVALAHELNARVIPLTGPSSILLALMASGLNGQCFAFWGYLPIKEPARSTRLKELEAASKRQAQTQIFIETPYRNEALLCDMLQHLKPATRLCVAQDISGAHEQIFSGTVAAWRQKKPLLSKDATVFLLLA
ncbi:MAG: SAM-dependent methyltransferase [Bacteroidetes bacterium]|nr:SAM-dependent methyltransferase [Bacteroidota bacterium]MBS1629798.1 SAM-dependent methyltransferase [Bacteroidota bacterium]